MLAPVLASSIDAVAAPVVALVAPRIGAVGLADAARRSGSNAPRHGASRLHSAIGHPAQIFTWTPVVGLALDTRPRRAPATCF